MSETTAAACGKHNWTSLRATGIDYGYSTLEQYENANASPKPISEDR